MGPFPSPVLRCGRRRIRSLPAELPTGGDRLGSRPDASDGAGSGRRNRTDDAGAGGCGSPGDSGRAGSAHAGHAARACRRPLRRPRGVSRGDPRPRLTGRLRGLRESFHWFDLSVALGEIARVLRPNGRLLIVWNVRVGDMPGSPSSNRSWRPPTRVRRSTKAAFPTCVPGSATSRKPGSPTCRRSTRTGSSGSWAPSATSPSAPTVSRSSTRSPTSPGPIRTSRTSTFALPYATRAIRCTRVTQAPDGLAST